MTFRCALFSLILLTQCAERASDRNQTIGGTRADGTAAELVDRNESDTLSYIGYIDKFDDNGSFYTDLYFVENFDYDLYDDLTKMGDVVVFEDGEVRRTKMTVERVGNYFNLTGLSNITIYNRNGAKLTVGRLSHIEYVEDLIESRYVAVFEVDNKEVSTPVPLFCVGNTDATLPEIMVTPYQNEKLTSDLLNFLHLDAHNVWGAQHYTYAGEILSSISVDTTAYIVSTEGDSRQVLYKSRSSEAIHDVTVVPFKANGREILLTSSGMPETDMTWTSLLIFDGTEYQVSRDHRMSCTETPFAACQ